jgi:inosine-uridine nucleoside N-ribohydrolase
MALYFALAHPAIDVVGITTTFGNVSVSSRLPPTRCTSPPLRAGRASRSPGASKPRGCKHPEAPPAFIHGADGLGNLGSRVATRNEVDPRSSAQFIVDMARAHPGEITLVAVGPLGNLSLALKLEPTLPTLLREVIIMGGTVLEPGNVSPVAEANIWNDPHAADRVFTAGWKLTMVGLDVTHRVITELSLFKMIADHHAPSGDRHAASGGGVLLALLQRPAQAPVQNAGVLCPRPAGVHLPREPRAFHRGNWPRAGGNRRSGARANHHEPAGLHQLPASGLGQDQTPHPGVHGGGLHRAA